MLYSSFEKNFIVKNLINNRYNSRTMNKLFINNYIFIFKSLRSPRRLGITKIQSFYVLNAPIALTSFVWSLTHITFLIYTETILNSEVWQFFYIIGK